MPIIDHPIFQRMDGKRQTGLLYKIYRGANHTRFEHSIGVFGLTDKIAKHLELSEEDSRALKAYALLHDISHIPFSHNIEPLLSTYHDDRAKDDMSAFQEVLKQCGVHFNIVKDIFHGSPLNQIVKHKVIGADKLDYMFRDPYHIGRKDGPDTKNLIQYLVFDQKKIMVEEKNAEEVMRTQNLYQDLHSFFYYIKQYLINQRILQRAVQESLDKGLLEEEDLYEMVDADLESKLYHSKDMLTRDLFHRIRNRGDTYKSVLVFRPEKYVHQERTAGKHVQVYPLQEREKFMEKHGHPRKLTKLEKALCKEMGYEDGTLLVTTILDFHRLSQPQDTILYSKDGSTHSLLELYPQHTKSLLDKAHAQFSIRVVAKEKEREDIYKQHEKIKGLMEEMNS